MALPAWLLIGGAKAAGRFVLDFLGDKRAARKRRRDRAERVEDAEAKAHVRMLNDPEDRASDLGVLVKRNGKWKRNVTFAVGGIPIVCGFIPGARPYLDYGFATIASFPDWYLIGLALMFISVWGYQGLLQLLLQMRLCSFFKRD